MTEEFDREYFHGDRGYRVDATGVGYRDFPINEVRADYIASKHPGNVLEIGAAAGFLVRRLRKMKIDAIGLDISKYAVEEMSPPDVREHLILGSAAQLPWPDKYFDMVVSIGTLEHLTPEDCDLAIKEILRVSHRGIIGICLSTGLASTLPKSQQDATHRSLHDYYWWRDRFPAEYEVWEDTEETFRDPFNKKILILSPSAYAIEIRKYGGIERLSFLISQEMARQGVDVTVASPTGSILPWGVKHLDTGPAKAADFVNQEASAFSKIFPFLGNYSAILDLSHSKITGRYYPYSYQQAGVIWHMSSLMKAPEPPWNVLSLSAYQANSYFFYQGRRARVLDVHCAEPSLENYPACTGDRFIFIGRLHPTKGALDAARLCNKLNVPLDIVGAITPAEPPDYVEAVKQEAKKGDIAFLGELPYESLSAVLGEARALLFPLAAGYEEAHSHKSVDALCMGVPVVAYSRGALPEVIEHGVDGYLADNPDQFLEYLKAVDSLDRTLLRRRAWGRWHPRVVVRNLLPMLQDVSRGARWG